MKKLKGLTRTGNVWYFAIKTPGGMKRISTGCTDYQAAVKAVHDSSIEDLQAAAKAGSLTQRAISHITTGKKMTLEKCLEPFTSWCQACAKSPKTISNNLTVIRAWLAHGGIGGLNPSECTEEHIGAFINDQESDSKAATRKVSLASIRSLFSFMAAKGWIASDPSRLVRVDYSKLDHSQKKAHVRQPFTAEEVSVLLDQIEKEEDAQKDFWRFAVIVSHQTGLRLTDICQLEWKCFSDPAVIDVCTDKTNAWVTPKMTPEISEALGHIQMTDDKYLFPVERTTILDDKARSLLSTRFGRLCKRAGIEGRSFHCLRHAYASSQDNAASESKEELAARLADTLTLDDLRKLMGHSSSKTTKGYIHGS